MFKDLAFFEDYNLFNNINQSVFLRYLTVKTNFTMPMCSHGRDDKKDFVLMPKQLHLLAFYADFAF